MVARGALNWDGGEVELGKESISGNILCVVEKYR